MSNSLEIKVRKEFLLFKKDKLREKKELESFLNANFDKSDFVLLDSDHITASLRKVRERQLQGVSSKNRLTESELDLSLEDVKKFLAASNESLPSALNVWGLVAPLSWESSGGFLMRFEDIFENFEEISLVADDDFDIFADNLCDQISFRGDRSSDELTSMEVRLKGDKFAFVCNWV